MSKKRQTTGLPSKNNISNAEAEYRTRAERDEVIQKWLVRGTTILGAVIILLLLIYVLVNQVIIPGQAVATVNGDAITVQEFRDRVLIERARLQQEVNRTVNSLQSMGMDPNQFFQQEPYSTWLSELNFPDQLGQRVLDDIIEDRLVAEEIGRRDIVIDEATIEKQVNNYFSYDPTQVALIGVEPTASPTATITPTPFVSPTPSPVPSPTAEPTLDPEATEEPEVQPTFTLPPEPTQSPDDVRQNYERTVDEFRNFIQTQAGVSAADMDAYFERLTRRAAVRDAITADLTTTLYANARHILVANETQAQDIIEALNNGESFSALAQAVSEDTGSGARGGELGWSPADRYVPEFRDAVAEAPIGEIYGPVQSQFGYHVIQVRAREEREVEGSELENIKDIAFGEWLTEQRDSEDNTIEISDNWTDYVPE